LGRADMATEVADSGKINGDPLFASFKLRCTLA
jgi:hypothetical protein